MINSLILILKNVLGTYLRFTNIIENEHLHDL